MNIKTLKKHFQAVCFGLLLSTCITVEAATQTIQGSTGQVHVPTIYAGKEAVLMCSMEQYGSFHTYIGRISSPSRVLYNVIGSYTYAGSVPNLLTSYSVNIPSLESGTYTITAAYLSGADVCEAGTSGSCSRPRCRPPGGEDFPHTACSTARCR